MTDRYADWDAAYVLGALDPRERREYATHLAGCAACRDAVAELAALPALLASVPAGSLPLPASSDGPAAGAAAGVAAGVAAGAAAGTAAGAAGDVVPFARVAAAARRSRLRRRAGMVAASSAIAVGGVLVGSALGPGLGPEPGSGPGPTTSPSSAAVAGAVTLELSPVGSAAMWADLVATPAPWGTRLEWSCRYDRPAGPTAGGGYGGAAEPVTYELVLVDRAGTRVVAATWTTADQEATGLGATSALPLAALARVEIAVAGRAEPLASATL